MSAHLRSFDRDSPIVRRAGVFIRRGGRVAKQRLPTFRAAANANRVSADEPRLLFVPAQDQWRVIHGGQAYEPETAADLQRLLGLLPLDVLDDSARPPAVGAGRTVKARRTGSAPIVEFYAGRGHQTTESPPGAIGANDVRWEIPVDDDGWVGTRARLFVDAARQVSIEVYLPPSGDVRSKELEFVATVGRRVESDVVDLGRGEPFWVDLFRSDESAHGLVINLRSSFAEPTTIDVRSLGFVLLDIAVKP